MGDRGTERELQFLKSEWKMSYCYKCLRNQMVSLKKYCSYDNRIGNLGWLMIQQVNHLWYRPGNLHPKNNRSTSRSSYITLGHMLHGTLNPTTEMLAHDVHCWSIHNNKKLETANSWWLDKIRYIYTVGYYSAVKKKKWNSKVFRQRDRAINNHQYHSATNSAT